jgi:hypothetical protein
MYYEYSAQDLIEFFFVYFKNEKKTLVFLC